MQGQRRSNKDIKYKYEYLRKSPQKRKEKTRTRAAIKRREMGKPEDTRGPSGTVDRVVLVDSGLDDDRDPDGIHMRMIKNEN